MFIRRISFFLLLLTSPLALLSQTATSNSARVAEEKKSVPKLEHFDPNLVDRQLNPCDDFYKYSCNKWLSANPIPPDQTSWNVYRKLAEEVIAQEGKAHG